MREMLQPIILMAIKSQEEFLDGPIDLSRGDESELYVDGGPLDSLSLMTIITDIERNLSSQHDIRVHLATERDLSLENSPFATLGKMIGYIDERVRLSALSGDRTTNIA